MYARSTTIEGRPGAVADAVTEIREHLLPAIADLSGCVGVSLLVDGASGCCVLTSAWQSAQALRAGEAGLAPYRDRVVAVLDGPAEDEGWEIAVVHRAHPAQPGTCVRTVRVHVDPETTDHGVDLYRTVLLPQIQGFEGFCSASLLVDPPSGSAVSSVAFDSREAMRHTRSLAAVVRDQGSREVSGEILDVAEFDLALAHLHVPELV